MVVIFTCPRLTNCSMNCQRRMTCFVLFPSLLRRVRQIPAVPHHCVSTSLSMSPMIHCSWMSCRINSESWRRKTWLCDPRYIRPMVCAVCAGYETNQGAQNPASGFLLKHMAILSLYTNHFQALSLHAHVLLFPSFLIVSSSSLFSVQL